MQNKRGQVTIFVIIAIVIVAAVIFFLVIRPKITQPSLSAEEAQKFLASQIDPIKKYTTDCIEKTFKKCTILIGYQGGYYKPESSRSVASGNYSLPYLVYKEGDSWVNDLPLLATIGRNIDECAKDNINEIKTCLNDFKTFKETMDISEKEMTFTINSIEEYSINVDANYPLVLTRSGVTSSIDKMPFSYPVGLGQAYKTATEITNSERAGQSFDIDTYSSKNPAYIYIERQGIPEGIFYYLTTIPPQANLEAFHFQFGIQR
jgi:hypothetical protein